MNPVRRHLAALLAIAVPVVIALVGPPREPGEPALAALAQRFVLSVEPLPEPPTEAAPKTRRAVHPALAGHDAWVSFAGAAVALADLDGDGLANDLCHVDPRWDTVAIAPVPVAVGAFAHAPRYGAFVLEPPASRFSARSFAPTGCRAVDLDENGALDLVVTYWGRTPVAFLRRASEALARGASAFVARELVEPVARWNTSALAAADVDGDGHLDVVVGNYFPDGDAVLDESGREPVTMQRSWSRARNGGRNRVLRWAGASSGPEPNVSFVEAPDALDARSAHAWTLAIGAADLDRDGLPELYFANDFGPDVLLANRSRPGAIRLAEVRGERAFTVPRSKTLGGDSFKGMGIDWADLDRDGTLDFFVSNIAVDWGLHESHLLFLSGGRDVATAFGRGLAPYEDGAEPWGVARGGWGWDARFVDFDADGALELVQATGFVAGRTNRWPELQELATANDELVRHPAFWPAFAGDADVSGQQPTRFYAQVEPGRFHDVAARVGLGEPWVTRGIAVGDVDGDCDPDLVLANQWQPSVLVRNGSPAAGPRLALAIERAAHAGSPAVGAEVRWAGADGRPQVAQVDGCSGHSGCRAHEILIAPGAAAAVAAPIDVTVRWRSTSGVVHEAALALAPGRHRLVVSDAGRLEAVAR